MISDLWCYRMYDYNTIAVKHVSELALVRWCSELHW